MFSKAWRSSFLSVHQLRMNYAPHPCTEILSVLKWTLSLDTKSVIFETAAEWHKTCDYFFFFLKITPTFYYKCQSSLTTIQNKWHFLIVWVQYNKEEYELSQLWTVKRFSPCDCCRPLHHCLALCRRPRAWASSVSWRAKGCWTYPGPWSSPGHSRLALWPGRWSVPPVVRWRCLVAGNVLLYCHHVVKSWNWAVFTFTSSHSSLSSVRTREVWRGVGGTTIDC